MRNGVAKLISDHGPQTCSRKFQFSCCLHSAEYHYLFEGHKLFEYQTEADLLNGPETEDKGAKD